MRSKSPKAVAMTNTVSTVQRCAEAAAAADQLKQHADAVEDQEARGMMQQLISQLVADQDKQRQAQAKVGMLRYVVPATDDCRLLLLELLYDACTWLAAVSIV